MKFDFKWKDSAEEARKSAETLAAANEAKKQAKSNTDNKKAAEPTHTLIAGRYIRACGDGEYRLYPFAKKEYMWRIPKKFILKYGKITVGDYVLVQSGGKLAPVVVVTTCRANAEVAKAHKQVVHKLEIKPANKDKLRRQRRELQDKHC
ncbi:hypothetical protein AGMMS49975_14160 [Clostridia bacterium]|nr:hypothetical protein AGMMS49975_14160 [Clostridia bacterium]